MSSAASDDEIRAALAAAEEFARGKASRGDAAEVARDAAVDAVVWASKNYRPARGPFPNYAGSAVAKFVKRALLKFRRDRANRPEVGGLPEHDIPARPLPSAGEIPMSAELGDIPEKYRAVVRFYFIDGYTMDEIGLLMGMCAATVRVRLIEAAELLSPGTLARHRKRKTKRLSKG